jgi:CheY-like chemotaxis protein
MPLCAGAACIKFVRREEKRRRAHTKIVAVTAHARAGEREYCRASGMDDLLTKPITMSDMQRMLKRHLKVA